MSSEEMTLTRQEKDKLRNAEYNLKNREAIKARKAAYYQANKERELKRQAEYRENNRGTKRMKDAIYCANNREKRRFSSRRYDLNNPESHARRVTRRKARLKNCLVIPYTEKQVVSLYGSNCHLCNEPIDMAMPRRVGKEGWQKALHIDHVVPIARGGSDTIENVRPSHAECNLHKYTKVV